MRKMLIVGLVGGLVSAGCGGGQSQPQTQTTQVQKVDKKEVLKEAYAKYLAQASQAGWNMVTPEDLAKKIEAGDTADIFIIDVRPEHLYAEGHVPGATNIPLPTLMQNLDKLPAGKTAIVVCVSGQTAAMGNVMLNTLGIPAKSLKGGMKAWTAANLPVAK